MISFPIRKESDRFACLSLNGMDEFTWCESSDFFHQNLWHTNFSIITFRNGSIVREVKKKITEPDFFDVVGTIEGKRSGGYRFRRDLPDRLLGQKTPKQWDILSWGKKEKTYRFRKIATQEGICAISQGRKFVCFADASNHQWLPDIMNAAAKRSAREVFDHQGPAIVDLDTGAFKTLEFSNLCPLEVRIHPSESMVAFLGENEVVIVDL